MSAFIDAQLQTALLQLKDKQQYRKLPDIEHHGRYVIADDNTLLNIASNDYLGLGSDAELQREFFEFIQQSMDCLPKMSATSSRLLTGNDTQLQALEDELQAWYETAAGINQTATKSALVLNSGYHANIGILPALTALPVKTVILADKLVHASMIDGIKLSESKRCLYRRYRHNDYAHLAIVDPI